MTPLRLRPVEDRDLPDFYEHQLDPEATAMADFPSRDRAAFEAHWAKIRLDPSTYLRSIEFGGELAGNLVSWESEGVRLVGYWLGRSYWGQGIATRALAEFLLIVRERPLYAHAAPGNLGSLRVLEKCGFVRCAEAPGDVTMRLDAAA